MSGVSTSYLCRIELENRFPSARVLRKIAQPLGFEVDKLLVLAGYLSPQAPVIGNENLHYSSERLDPYVARVLAQEPIQVQHTVIRILNILRSLAISMAREKLQR